jgi:hypothetical protein
MNENIDQLSETFAAHEHLAPDAADVLEKANAIARSFCRRRRAARATGASVLGAGLVAGGVVLPRLQWHTDSSGGITFVQPASGGGAPTSTGAPSATGTPSASGTPRAYTQQQELDAYFADGYDYDNAVQLGQLWHEIDIAQVKADAGLKLLQGAALPVTPSGTPETPQEKAQTAFFTAGYDYNDAVTLGNLWHETDLAQVKAEAGQKLLDGQTLPIAPTGPSASAASSPTVPDQAPALAAFFAAGYDYNDAVTLGNLWHETDLAQVKADAGQKLLAGQTLPIAPTGTPQSSADRALAAYFAAGYTYNDAVTLGKLWHETDIAQIKAEAGQKLLEGQTLPIAP